MHPRFIHDMVLIVTSVLLGLPGNASAQDELASMNEIESGSILDDTYTLGRIVGSRTTYNLTQPFFEDNSVLLFNTLHSSIGNDNKSAYGFTAIEALGIGEGFGFLLMVPEFDLIFAPAESHRFSITLMPTNLYFVASENDARVGFQTPFLMVNRYSWQFLSRDGRIEVPSDQNENSFFFGPQLNPGQFSFGIGFAHPIAGSTVDISGVPDFHVNFGIGLPENISNTTGFSWSHVSEPYTSMNYNYPYNFTYNYDTIGISSVFEWRTPITTVNAGYLFTNIGNMDDNFNSISDNYWNNQQHVIRLGGTFISGPNSTSFSEVNGNWDGTFSSLLHARQLMAQLHSTYLTRSNSGFNLQSLSLDNSIRYGITDFVTVGYEGILRVPFDEDVTFSATPGIHVSNIPRRTRGPAEVSPFEYKYGYWPRYGEYRLDIRYRLPLNDPPLDASPYLYDYITINNANNVLGVTSLDADIDGWFYGKAADPRNSLMPNYDGQASISAGVAPRINIFNTFNMRIVESYYPEFSWLSDTEPENNFIYANQFGVAFGNPQQRLFHIMLGLFGQTRQDVNDEERFDFSISLLYTSSL